MAIAMTVRTCGVSQASKSFLPSAVDRLRTHSQNIDGCSDADGGRTSVMACGDPSQILEPTEHDFDAVATFVFSLVIFYLFSVGSPSRAAKPDPSFL